MYYYLLQIVYLQHLIEIILKHLLVLWDGDNKSKNPDVIMSGPIGIKVENLHKTSKEEINGVEVEVENLKPFVDVGKIYAFKNLYFLNNKCKKGPNIMISGRPN